ncbi:MAG: ArsR family transcriptional regulator [Candidatus Thermoplasmatota archaeon]|jgi:predicted DNA-binding ArsR family transcriptional regulator|nr:ArsR family transcriptional regulator [Candidatus Thermoplasmatota archaeon]
MNKIKVVNDVGELVTVFTISNTEVKRSLLKMLNEKWLSEEEVVEKLGTEAIEILRYLEKIKFIESQWSSTPKGPKKVYHNYYTSIQINILILTEETADVIYVASLDDKAIEDFSKKIEDLISNGIQYIAEIQEKLNVTSTYLRVMIKRSKTLTIKGMKVERI